MSGVDLNKPAKVRAAIRRAVEYADEHKVPLTAERLAAELQMDGDTFRRYIDPAYQPEEESMRPALQAIRSANTQAVASVLEHALSKGSGVNMHMLYLKQYAGYAEAASVGETGAVVRFCGEADISD